MNEKLKGFIEEAGWPRVIIGLFLLSLFVAAPFVQVRVDASISDTFPIPKATIISPARNAARPSGTSGQATVSVNCICRPAPWRPAATRR